MIGQFSFTVVAVLVFSGFQVVTVSAYKCVECASLGLRDNWQLTAFPVKYTDEKYSLECDEGGGNTQMVDCTTPCLEMIIPTNDRYVFLRGCHDNLLSPSFRSNASLINNAFPAIGDCEYGKTNRRVNIIDSTTIIGNDTGYIGIHFCKSKEESLQVNVLCNNVMKLSAMVTQYKQGGGKAEAFFSGFQNGEVKCPPSSSKVNCIDCISVGDNGACDKHTTSTCAGAYCSKTFGKQGLTEFVRRSCSPINPYGFATDGCARIDIQSNIPLSDGTAGAARRMKRADDLNLNYNVDQCYCTTDKCNGAASLTFAFVSIVSPILIAVRLL